MAKTISNKILITKRIKKIISYKKVNSNIIIKNKEEVVYNINKKKMINVISIEKIRKRILIIVKNKKIKHKITTMNQVYQKIH